MKSWVVALGLAAAGSSVPSAGLASEWGCQVLLCASSSNPSWRGVPACHPPMYKLISAMKRPGFSWPTCPEGGAGKPGHEPYADCPAGWAATTDPDSDRRSSLKSHCAKTVNLCEESRRAPSGRDGESCMRTEVMARSLRQDPYYFDIRDETDGTVSRHWFNLTK